MKRLLAALSIVALVVLAACGSDNGATTDEGPDTATGGEDAQPDESGAQGELEVTTVDFAFQPSSLTADPGEITVVLTNEDSAEHSFTIEELDVEAEAHGGETAQATFTAMAGTYEFFCEYHPEDMRGTLTVGGAPAGGGGDDMEEEMDDPNNPNY